MYNVKKLREVDIRVCKILEDMREEAARIAREEGREEGRVEEKQNVARYLATMDFPLEKIAETVKVSVNVIKQWLDSSTMTLVK
jgi:predicted transposase YdaD